jgi:hypothetical protein
MTSEQNSFRSQSDVVMPTAEDLEQIAREADQEAGVIGPSQMIRGGLIVAAGFAIAVVSYSAILGVKLYVVAYGVMLGGFGDFIVGFSNWMRGRRAKTRDESILPR